MCVSSRPSGSEMICLRERQTRFSSSICWQKLRVARISEFSSLTPVLQKARSNRRGNTCESANRNQEFKILTTQGSSEWNEEGIKALARVLMRQARDKDVFPTARHQSVHLRIYKRFCDNLDLEQHGDDFLVCGLTSHL